MSLDAPRRGSPDAWLLMPIMLRIRKLSSLRRLTRLCLASLRDNSLELERGEQFMNSPTDGGQAYNLYTAKAKKKSVLVCLSYKAALHNQ